jgi:hypothetical protein
MQTNSIFFLLLCGIFIVIGLYNIIKDIRLYLKVRASESWPETVGTITQAVIRHSTGQKGGKSYYADFAYSYTLLGSAYEGKFKIRRFFATEGAAKKNVSEHPTGSTLAVRYNPEKQQEALTDYDRVFPFDVVIFLVMLLIGIYGIFLSFLK